MAYGHDIEYANKNESASTYGRINIDKDFLVIGFIVGAIVVMVLQPEVVPAMAPIAEKSDFIQRAGEALSRVLQPAP